MKVRAARAASAEGSWWRFSAGVRLGRTSSVRDTGREMTEDPTTPDLGELVRKQTEAANRRDLDAWANAFAEDATFDGRTLGDHYEGRSAIRSFVEAWWDIYEELVSELEEVCDLGNGVVFAVVVQNGRPAGSAGHVRQHEGWVIVWVGGLIASIAVYEVEEGRAAAERLVEERG